MQANDYQPLSLVDHFWLRQDRPYNYMTISSVFILKDKMDLESLKETINTRWVLPYKRFRQRPVYHLRGVRWETDTHFEISNHFRRVGLPGAQDKEALEEFVSNLVSTPQAIVTFGLMEVMGLGPKIAQASAMRMLSKKATAVMTNVPGPQQPLYLAGSKLVELMFWVPQSGSVGMGVSIISYNNRVHFGLITDQKLVKDPETIISQFAKEFEHLLLITLMGFWGERLDKKVTADTNELLEASTS